MSTLSATTRTRAGSSCRFLPRRIRRLPISCETLELRQVLSAGQAGAAHSVLNQVVAQPSIQSAPFSQVPLPPDCLRARSVQPTA